MTTFPSYPKFKNYWFTTFLAVGLLPMGLATIAFNCLVFKFYVSKRDNVLHTMYMMLSLTDIVSGVAAVLQGLTLLVISGGVDSIAIFLVPLVFFLASLSSHVSAFYSTTLVVVRSINIIWPLKLIQRNFVCAAVIVYPLLWSGIIAYEIGSFFWPNEYYSSEDIYLSTYYLLVAPNAGSELIIKVFPSILEKFQSIIFVVCTGIPYFLPSVITIVCCGVQIHALKNTPSVGNKSSDRNTKITATILQLTLLFAVCNTAHSITLLALELSLPKRNLWVWYTLYIVSNFLPFLNSLLNPCILITRGKTLRDFVKSTIGMNINSAAAVSTDNKSLDFAKTKTTSMKRQRWGTIGSMALLNKFG